MSKMSTDLVRHALNGPTMGTRWSALFFAPAGFDPGPIREALQAAVDRVDEQMSTWKPGSALMRLNAAPVGAWCDLPGDLARVLHLGLAIGRASGGAFDIATGDAVAAWGFGPAEAAPAAIRAATGAPRRPAWECLDLDGRRLRKRAPVTLDLNGAVVIRAKSGEQTSVTDLVLRNSRRQGEAERPCRRDTDGGAVVEHRAGWS